LLVSYGSASTFADDSQWPDAVFFFFFFNVESSCGHSLDAHSASRRVSLFLKLIHLCLLYRSFPILQRILPVNISHLANLNCMHTPPATFYSVWQKRFFSAVTVPPTSHCQCVCPFKV